MHKSIFSARSDIKYLQDIAERTLTFEVQPLMSMLDGLGLEYNRGIIDKAWETLVKCQTHSSATLTDETNEYIKVQSNNAVNIAVAAKVYLMKIIAISINAGEGQAMPLVVYNTLPERRDISMKLNVYTKNKNFNLILNGKQLDYTVVECQEQYGGVLRKDKSLMKEDKHFYKTKVIVTIKDFDGISYQTIYVHEQSEDMVKTHVVPSGNSIENARYKVEWTEKGVQISDKKTWKGVQSSYLYRRVGG